MFKLYNQSKNYEIKLSNCAIELVYKTKINTYPFQDKWICKRIAI